MRRIIPLLLLAMLVPQAQAAAVSADRPSLYGNRDTELQAALEWRLARNPEWARLIRSEKMAVGVVDMSGPSPRFAAINGDHMMYAASLPKIAIMLAVYASFEDGSLRETPTIHQDLGDMIRVSSNPAATRLMDLVGMRKIQAVLQDPRFGFYDPERGGGLWVGKRYAATGTRIGDPVYNISHGATVTQVCRFFYLLATHRLISPYRSVQMLADLSDPGLNHKFVRPISERAPKARLYRKSGTWKQWHADAIMVQGPEWRNYILVGLVESSNGEQILRSVLPAVEDLLRDHQLSTTRAQR